jgi:uncharacterized protein YfaS (alpha-2-macroglobulin family)
MSIMKRIFLIVPLFFLWLSAGALNRSGNIDDVSRWKSIEKFMEDGFIQSAMIEIDEACQSALKDKAYGRLLKAITLRTNCLQMTEDNPDVAIIRSLIQDVEVVPYPAKSVIFSLIGEAFRDYYLHNRWKLSGRTSVYETTSENLYAWSSEMLINEMSAYFIRSLEHSELLQQTSVSLIKDVLRGDDATRVLRPSLYDFLAHRAIDALKDPTIMQQDFSTFLINQVAYFSDAQGFVKLNISNDNDSLASAYCVMKILQDLTVFRLQQKDLNALTDVDLKRLQFVKDNGIYANAGTLYEEALKYMLETCSGEKIWGKVASTLAAWYEEEGKKWTASGDTKYRYRLVDAVRLYSMYQKKALSGDDKTYAENLLKELKKRQLNIQLQKEQIPGKPMLALISYRNVTEAYISVFRINHSLSELDNIDQTFLSKQEKYARQTILLPKQTDFQRHNVEVRLDSLDTGKYLLVISDKPDFTKDKAVSLSYTTVQVSNIFLIQRLYGEGNMSAYVTHRESGLPIEEVEIKIYRKVYQRETNGYEDILDTILCTDASGQALYSNKSGNRTIYAFHEQDTLLQNGVYAYSGTSGTSGKAEPERIMLLTDRSIYRPGQTLYFKGLMYTGSDGKQQALPETAVQVQLMDANDKEVTQQDFTTNDFGSFQGSFVLPHNHLNGVMRLQTPHGAVSFSVEEYKRPTFEVIAHPVSENYALGDSIRITGEAKALSGYPVNSAKVHFSVSRRVLFRPLRYYAAIRPPARKAQRQITSGVVRTDNNGQFSITFEAEDDDIQDKTQIYVYDLKIDITDLNGETQSVSQTICLSEKSLLLDIGIPEQIVAGTDSLQYKLDVTNLNGVSTPAEVQVAIFAVQSPGRILRDRLWSDVDTVILPLEAFKADFPFDAYSDENKYHTHPTERLTYWNINTQTAREIDLGVLKKMPVGWYMIKLTAQNQQGTLTDSMMIRLQHTDSAIIDMSQWLTVASKKGEPGDSVTFRLAGGKDSSYIRCDLLFKDKTVVQKTFMAGVVPKEIYLPIKEEYRGGFAVQFVMVQENRYYTALHEIDVPYSNKELDISFQSFRGQLLPGEKEKWTLTVKNKGGGREIAEMAATLYDASLDIFAPHQWKNTFYPSRYHGYYGWQMPYVHLQDRNIPVETAIIPVVQNRFRTSFYVADYEALTVIGGGQQSVMLKSRRMGATRSDFDLADERIEDVVMVGYGSNGLETQEAIYNVETAQEMAKHDNIPLRSNFSETAFFYPALHTNEKGEIVVNFTIPDVLTRWKMLGFAHTKDIKIGYVSRQLITQKKIAISAHLPRFFRQGDTLILAAKVNNLTESDQKVSTLLRFYDAFTMQPIDARILKSDGMQSLSVAKGQSADVQWKLVVPDELSAVSYRLTATAGNHSDGEERSVPVFCNRILVTETMPFMVRSDGQSDFRFDKLAKSSSVGTLQHRRLTLEYTDNPVWYAVQALPSLMERSNECSEQTFARFYANSLANKLAKSTPHIRQVLNQWRAIPDSKALLSKLEKNQELKQVLLEETPWVMQATNETERRKRIGLLFDLNRMANEQQSAWEKLNQMQGVNGGIPWISGYPEDRYITQHIVIGLEHLRKLGALPHIDDVNDLIDRAMNYCDAKIDEDYKKITAGKSTERKQRITAIQLHYLYMCSFSQRRSYANLAAFDFYMQQTERYWSSFNVYEQAMAAILLYRYGKADIAQNILRSLKERAKISDESGMYWTYKRGYFWYEAPIETQAMLIEAFNEVGSDSKAVDEMKLWLLRNKQTTDWKTTKATTESLYALLMNEYDMFDEQGLPVDIRIGGKTLKKIVCEPLNPEAGTGYVNTSWNGKDVSASMADLRVTNPRARVVWGAMYWQYFEESDKVTTSEPTNQLFIEKKLFAKRITDKGVALTPINRPKIGDVVTVRLTIRADRDFEYVHLKDMRAAGFEPINPVSNFHYQDGLGYYESFKDATVNFFIHYLPAGAYVFEYDLRVTQAGDFADGIATIQCMYAPEFHAHSKGGRQKVLN